MAENVTCNGRSYSWPAAPTVVICLDGSEPGYIERAIDAGVAPTFARFMRDGLSVLADSVIPSFTNPNNLSIITGCPPAVHGIAGNFFYDRETRSEVMMNDARFMRAPTILKAFHDVGAKVAMVTAKDKLRLLLSNGLDYGTGRAIAFSSERADKTSKTANGIENALDFTGLPLPDVYSARLSEFVFAAGVKLMTSFRPDLMYLSTTDYIQHKAGPGTKIANEFYGMIDGYLAALDARGAVIVATADHGMNDKHDASTKAPNVLYLQSLCDEWAGKDRSRVILPITDPYVAHHGALGSFATIHTENAEITKLLMDRLHSGDFSSQAISAKGGMPALLDCVITRDEACARFELPPDRIGDIVVLSARHMTLGTSPERHDLSGLDEPLRSHGGLTEQRVPMIANRRIALPSGQALRNFDVFSVALNHSIV